MPKLCRAACHRVDFNLVTSSVLLKGEQLIFLSSCTNSTKIPLRIGTMFICQVLKNCFFFCSHISLYFSLFSFWIRSPEAHLLCFYQDACSSMLQSSWTFDDPPLSPLPLQNRVQVMQQIRLTHSYAAESPVSPRGRNNLCFWTDGVWHRCSAPHLTNLN